MTGKYPSPHSYLLLEEKHRLHPRGSLLRLKKNGTYESRNHLFSLTPRSPEVNGSVRYDEDMAPLTLEEFHLLDAIISPATRYTVYSTPGKMAWGLGLKVGDTVLAKLPPVSGCVNLLSLPSETPELSMAVIKWIGIVKKHMFGVEIVEEQFFGRGDTDGTYHYSFNQVQKLFDCKHKHGLFLTLDKMEMPPSLQAITSHLQGNVVKLESQLRARTQRVQELTKSEGKLQGEVRQLEAEAREHRKVIIHSQGQAVLKENLIARLQDELKCRNHGRCDGESGVSDFQWQGSKLSNTKHLVKAQEAQVRRTVEKRERMLEEWKENVLTMDSDDDEEEEDCLSIFVKPQDSLNVVELEKELNAAKAIIQEEMEQMGRMVIKWQEEARKKDLEIAKYEEELRAAKELVQDEVAERANVIAKWEEEVESIYNKVAKFGEKIKATKAEAQREAKEREEIVIKWREDREKKNKVISELQKKLRVAEAQLKKEKEERTVNWKEEVRKKEKKIADLRQELSTTRAKQDELEELLEDSENVAAEWMNEARKRENVLSKLLEEVRECHKVEAQVREEMSEKDQALCSLKKELAKQKRQHLAEIQQLQQPSCTHCKPLPSQGCGQRGGGKSGGVMRQLFVSEMKGEQSRPSTRNLS